MRSRRRFPVHAVDAVDLGPTSASPRQAIALRHLPVCLAAQVPYEWSIQLVAKVLTCRTGCRTEPNRYRQEQDRIGN
jgi:hypothetical protein